MSGEGAGGGKPREKSRCRRFYVAFNACHLPRKIYSRAFLYAVIPIKKSGGIYICIAVHNAVSEKNGVLKSGNHREDPFLFRKCKMSLKADDVEHRSFGIFAPQLDYRIIFFSGFGMSYTDGLQRSEAERILSAARHLLDGHTAFKHLESFALLEIVKLCDLCADELEVEGFILFLVHRAIDIIGRSLLITRSKKRFCHIDRGKINYGSCGIEEMKFTVPYEFCDAFGECVGRKRSRGNHRRCVVRDIGNLAFDHLDKLRRADLLRYI